MEIINYINNFTPTTISKRVIFDYDYLLNIDNSLQELKGKIKRLLLKNNIHTKQLDSDLNILSNHLLFIFLGKKQHFHIENMPITNKILLLIGELTVYNNSQYICSLNENSLFSIKYILSKYDEIHKQKYNEDLSLSINKSNFTFISEDNTLLLILSSDSPLASALPLPLPSNHNQNQNKITFYSSIKSYKSSIKLINTIHSENLFLKQEEEVEDNKKTYVFIKDIKYFHERMKVLKNKLALSYDVFSTGRTKLNELTAQKLGIKRKLPYYERIKEIDECIEYMNIYNEYKNILIRELKYVNYNSHSHSHSQLERKEYKELFSFLIKNINQEDEGNYYQTLYIRNILYISVYLSVKSIVNYYESHIINSKLNSFFLFINSDENNSYFDLKLEMGKESFDKFVIRKLMKTHDIKYKYRIIKEKAKKFAEINLKYNKERYKIYNNLLCLKCKKRPRNIMSSSCGHIIFCEKCIGKCRICVKCGIEIQDYVKLYRC